MYNQIYSIINDFIKAFEQDKNFSVLLKKYNSQSFLMKKRMF